MSLRSLIDFKEITSRTASTPESLRRSAKVFMLAVKRYKLFDPVQSGSKGYYQQNFSVGIEATSEDLDHARAFAEGLRERFGGQLFVYQHMTTVYFGPKADKR